MDKGRGQSAPGVLQEGGQNSPAEWLRGVSGGQTMRMALPVMGDVLGSVLGFGEKGWIQVFVR